MMLLLMVCHRLPAIEMHLSRDLAKSSSLKLCKHFFFWLVKIVNDAGLFVILVKTFLFAGERVST